MASDPSFELLERDAFAGMRSWRLKDGQIRFRGRDTYGQPLPPAPRIPVSSEQIAKFIRALDFLEVWKWRRDYNPEGCGRMCDDGMSWSFKALIGGQACEAGGENAFPSFADATRASLDPDRYAFLVFAIRAAFEINE